MTSPEIIFNFFSHLPENLTTVILTIILVVIVWLFRKIILPLLELKQQEIKKKMDFDKEILYSLQKSEITTLHNEMTQIIRNCFRKGYRNDFDRLNFLSLYSNYIHIEGNTDREVLRKDFESIPYKVELVIPLELGQEVPDEKTREDIIDLYNKLKNNIITKEKDDEKK